MDDDIASEREKRNLVKAEEDRNAILMATSDEQALAIAQQWGNEEDYPWVVKEALRLRSYNPPSSQNG